MLFFTKNHFIRNLHVEGLRIYEPKNEPTQLTQCDFVIHGTHKSRPKLCYDGSCYKNCVSYHYPQPLFCLCRTTSLSFDCFGNLSRFSKELMASFGTGIIINGSVGKGNLSDYLMFLKDDYISKGEPKCFSVANHIGYMGKGYWFLSPEVSSLLTLANLYVLLWWYIMLEVVGYYARGGWWYFWHTVMDKRYYGGLLCLIWWQSFL